MEIKSLIKDILNAGLQNKEIDLNSYAENEEFIKLMKEQTFQPWLYYVCKNELYQKYFFGSALIHDQFNYVGKMIANIFEKEGIDYIFLKGYVLKELYPNENLRMLGDIDVLVRLQDYKKAKQALMKYDFKYVIETDNHSSFIKRKLEIELHHKPICLGDFFHDYFFDAFKYAYQNKGHEYKLDDTNHFIYIIAHYLKHMKLGAGLREVVDLYLMLLNYSIDMDMVRKVMKEHQTEAFLDLLLEEIDYFFDYHPYPYSKNKYLEKILDFSINAGIHGFGSDNRWIENKMNNISTSKFAFLLKILFVPIPTLFNLYPWTKSIILIPFGYIYRFFYLLFNKKKQLKQVVKADFKRRNLSIYEMIGLDKEDIR